MSEQRSSKEQSKKDCTCTETCERMGDPFPSHWSWRCKLLPYEQPHPLARAAHEPRVLKCPECGCSTWECDRQRDALRDPDPIYGLLQDIRSICYGSTVWAQIDELLEPFLGCSRPGERDE